MTDIVNLPEDVVRSAKQDLAACFRAAAQNGFSEGICNHFSAMLPGSDEFFIINPFGLAFSEIRASDLLVCDLDGNVVAGDGAKPEDTALYIHRSLHREVPRARVAFHAHMPYATALSLVYGQPLKWCSQNALRFYGRTLVSDVYEGLALDGGEGDRIAATVGDADIVFLRHHGVMVIGETIAQAWDDIYYLERCSELQVLAESTGRGLIELPQEVIERTARQFKDQAASSADAHLASVRRCLDAEGSDYAS